jgi:ribosomal protein L4
VITGEEADVAKSYRNLKRVAVVSAEGVGVAEIIGHRSMVVTEEALAVLESRVGEVTRGSVAADTGAEGDDS